jgi:hypothetical protein
MFELICSVKQLSFDCFDRKDTTHPRNDAKDATEIFSRQNPRCSDGLQRVLDYADRISDVVSRSHVSVLHAWLDARHYQDTPRASRQARQRRHDGASARLHTTLLGIFDLIEKFSSTYALVPSFVFLSSFVCNRRQFSCPNTKH